MKSSKIKLFFIGDSINSKIVDYISTDSKILIHELMQNVVKLRTNKKKHTRCTGIKKEKKENVFQNTLIFFMLVYN